jgi:hypothetical protein
MGVRDCEICRLTGRDRSLYEYTGLFECCCVTDACLYSEVGIPRKVLVLRVLSLDPFFFDELVLSLESLYSKISLFH